MPTNVRYIVKASDDPIAMSDLQEGLTVCFDDVAEHPNNIGILTSTPVGNIEKGRWYAQIGGSIYSFTNTGQCIQDYTKILYKPEYITGTLSVNKSNTTRSVDEHQHIEFTSILTMLPKDNFAMAAMQALIQKYNGDALSMTSGTISAIASKAYLFGQAMFEQASLAREADKNADPYAQIDIDPEDLTEDTDKILYNMLNVMKGVTEDPEPEPEPEPEQNPEEQTEE